MKIEYKHFGNAYLYNGKEFNNDMGLNWGACPVSRIEQPSFLTLFYIFVKTINTMELKVEMNYNQLLRLIRQLPEREIKKLTTALQSEIIAGKPKESLQDLILQAPTWTDSDYEAYNNARTNINKSRIA